MGYLSHISPRRRHLETATLALQETERTTNYLNALDESYFEIRTEMREANEEDRQRSRYVVIFLSDGLPDDGGTTGRQRQGEAITETIRRMRDLKNIFGVREIVYTPRTSRAIRAARGCARRGLAHPNVRRWRWHFRSFASGEGPTFAAGLIEFKTPV